MKQKKGRMSKIIVCCILFFMAGVALWAMRIMSRTSNDVSALVGVIYAFWGSELLMLLMKRIFAKSEKEGKKEDIE